MELNSDTFNRLSMGFIEKDGCTPEDAVKRLESLCLNLVCSVEIGTSLPLQAALLTAINTGKRAFMGGVYCQLSPDTKSLLPWPGKTMLCEIVKELGGKIINDINNDHFSLFFGTSAGINSNAAQVVCNNWQAGVLCDMEAAPFSQSGNIPTAGVFAGALAVLHAFLKESGIDITALDESIGVSLWRPDLDWLDESAAGPFVHYLPNKFWLLGLGHLGQAYCWNIGLLPYKKEYKVSLLLQDTDKIVPANWSAGLLTEKTTASIYKTRLCSSWLEARQLRTTVTERKFDANTRRMDEEPFAALCGFDSAASRLPLEETGFDLIAEAGLGSNVSTFDRIALHTFPRAGKTPKDIWGKEDETNPEINERVLQVLKKTDKEVCGIIPLSISGKSVSASFVGACAGAMIIAELLRALNGGFRYDQINIQLRDSNNRLAIPNSRRLYGTELSRNGFIRI